MKKEYKLERYIYLYRKKITIILVPRKAKIHGHLSICIIKKHRCSTTTIDRQFNQPKQNKEGFWIMLHLRIIRLDNQWRSRWYSQTVVHLDLKRYRTLLEPN